MTSLVTLFALVAVLAPDRVVSASETRVEVETTAEPDGSAEADVGTEPDAGTESDGSIEPDPTTEPDGGHEPGGSIEPVVGHEPGGNTEPVATTEPDATVATTTTESDDTEGNADEDDEGKKNKEKDEKKKKKKKKKDKKLEWSVGGRVMGGWEVERERPVDMPAETKHEPFLRQARIKVRLDYKKVFKIRASLELADALKAPNFDRVSYLRNAYGEVRFHAAARLRFGYFKRPFSRLELRSPSDLPFRGRGLANGLIIEDRNYGDRSVGTMMWGKIAPARLSWYAGAFAPALRTKGVDAIGRLQADPLEWLSFGVSGGYKRVENGIGQMVDAGSFGGDLRVKVAGFYFLGDLVLGKDYLVPGEPLSLGLVGYASYDIDLPKKLVLQPVALAEWADSNIEVSQNDAIRSIVGLNLIWRKRFRVMPQVELIRPRGVVDNPWTNQDTYYVMLSLDL